MKEYKKNFSSSKKNNPSYETDFYKRVKNSIRLLNLLIKKATEKINTIKDTGHPQKLNPETKLRIRLIKKWKQNKKPINISFLDMEEKKFS